MGTMTPEGSRILKWPWIIIFFVKPIARTRIRGYESQRVPFFGAAHNYEGEKEREGKEEEDSASRRVYQQTT